MPLLDVSDIILDPDFCEFLTVYRREEVVDTKGRATVTPVLITPAPIGVVEPQDDLPLQRGPDQQNLPQLLEVHSQFRLRSASNDPSTGKNYQPDVIVWNGDQFLVNRVMNWSKFGKGFIRAQCSSVDPIDDVPV
jgi:hypothetical protein